MVWIDRHRNPGLHCWLIIFRTVDVESAVHSLLLPMVMLCTHKHALGACTPHSIDAAKFIADHVERVLAGLLPTEAEPRRAIRPIKSR